MLLQLSTQGATKIPDQSKIPNQTTKYSPGLKELLFSNRISKYKEISSLLTLFTEQRLDSGNSNFLFNRIHKILISLEAGQITYYDDLFCELFLHRYRTQVKKYVNFLNNITKVKHFKKRINFAESINFFLDQGENNSNRHLMEQRMVKSYDKKILYLKMFFIFILTTIILLVIVSKQES